MQDSKTRLRQAVKKEHSPFEYEYCDSISDDVVSAVLAELLKIAEEQPATTEHGTPSLDFLREVIAAQ